MQTPFSSNTETENTLRNYDVNDLKSGYLSGGYKSETERGPERLCRINKQGS